MKVFISEADRQNARRTALVNIAKFYSIPDWQYDDSEKLYNKVLAYTNPLNPLLNEYFDAYDAWFNFYKKIKIQEEKMNEEYNLKDEQKIELSKLIRKRQDTLDNLQKKFDQEQFEKFKRMNGLENVQGINLSE